MEQQADRERRVVVQVGADSGTLHGAAQQHGGEWMAPATTTTTPPRSLSRRQGARRQHGGRRAAHDRPSASPRTCRFVRPRAVRGRRRSPMPAGRRPCASTGRAGLCGAGGQQRRERPARSRARRRSSGRSAAAANHGATSRQPQPRIRVSLPLVVVVRLAGHRHHRVDRRRTTDSPATHIWSRWLAGDARPGLESRPRPTRRSAIASRNDGPRAAGRFSPAGPARPRAAAPSVDRVRSAGRPAPTPAEPAPTTTTSTRPSRSVTLVVIRDTAGQQAGQVGGVVVAHAAATRSAPPAATR